MKIFNSIQNSFLILGIHKPEPKCNRFTLKRCLILYIFTQISFSTTLFFLIDAKSFRDYTYSLYMAATSTLYVSCFSLVIFYMEKIFQLIENLECIIGTRKFNKNTIKNNVENQKEER